MRRLILVTLLLAGCGGENAAINQPTEVLPTPRIFPPIPTEVSINDIDLESLLIQDGDLPAGFSGAQINDEAPKMFEDSAKPLRAVNQQFEYKGEGAGSVTLLVYTDTEELEAAYDKRAEGMLAGGSSPDDVGEKAYVRVGTLAALNFSEAVFARCAAVVYVRMVGIKNADSVEAYGKRLDKRIQASPLCAPITP